MADTRDIILKVLEILLGIVIIGICGGTGFILRAHGFVLFSGIFLLAVALILLIMHLIGQENLTVVSAFTMFLIDCLTCLPYMSFAVRDVVLSV